jgi:hypothetical protein
MNVDGTVSVVDYGFVSSTSPGVSIDNGIKVSLVSGGGTPFSIGSDNMRGILQLERSTKYYINAYVVKVSGEVQYATEISVTTGKGNRWISNSFQSQFPGTVSFFVSAAKAGSDIYVVGGIQYVDENGNENVPNDELYKFDLTLRIWKKLANFPGKAGAHRPFLTIGEKIYYVGDQDKKTWEYDIAKNRWAQKADFPMLTETDFVIGFALGNKLFAGNGTDENPAEFYAFDPSDNSDGLDEFGNPKGKWTAAAAVPGNEHFRNFAFTAEGKGYLLKGGTEVELHEYNPGENEWTKIATVPGILPNAFGGNVDAFAFSIGDKIYCSAGVNESLQLVDFWVYDISENEWTEINGEKQNDFLKATNWVTAFSYENTGYLFEEYSLVRYIP